MFEIASRKKLRFDSPQGLLTVEDLWDLPLTSERGNRANLDDIARGLHRQMKDDADVSFVSEARAKADDGTALKLDIVKRVIEVKLAEKKAAAEARANAEKKQKILAIIARKEDQQLEGASLDELQKLAESL